MFERLEDEQQHLPSSSVNAHMTRLFKGIEYIPPYNVVKDLLGPDTSETYKSAVESISENPLVFPYLPEMSPSDSKWTHSKVEKVVSIVVDYVAPNMQDLSVAVPVKKPRTTARAPPVKQFTFWMPYNTEMYLWSTDLRTKTTFERYEVNTVLFPKLRMMIGDAQYKKIPRKRLNTESVLDWPSNLQKIMDHIQK